MNVDAEVVVDKLLEQIKQMSKAVAIKDAYMEVLQGDIAKLSAELAKLKKGE
jgi:hypothetical protein